MSGPIAGYHSPDIALTHAKFARDGGGVCPQIELFSALIVLRLAGLCRF